MAWTFDEFNLADYECLYKHDGYRHSLLAPVSKQRNTRGGSCRYSAVSDVLTSQRIILEATLPPHKTSYFHHNFVDVLSEQQLADTRYRTVGHLFRYCKEVGLTTTLMYNNRAEAIIDEDEQDGQIVRQLSGCPKFTFDEIGYFTGEKMNISVEDIQSETHTVSEGFCSYHIYNFSPVFGSYLCRLDNARICDVPLYESTEPYEVNEFGTVIGHGVMLTGFGIATCTDSGRKVSFYNFQNNWGTGTRRHRKKATGRIPCDYFREGFAPILIDQPNLSKFISNGGSENTMIVKKGSS